MRILKIDHDRAEVRTERMRADDYMVVRIIRGHDMGPSGKYASFTDARDEQTGSGFVGFPFEAFVAAQVGESFEAEEVQ